MPKIGESSYWYDWSKNHNYKQKKQGRVLDPVARTQSIWGGWVRKNELGAVIYFKAFECTLLETCKTRGISKKRWYPRKTHMFLRCYLIRIGTSPTTGMFWPMLLRRESHVDAPFHYLHICSEIPKSMRFIISRKMCVGRLDTLLCWGGALSSLEPIRDCIVQMLKFLLLQQKTQKYHLEIRHTGSTHLIFQQNHTPDSTLGVQFYWKRRGDVCSLQTIFLTQNCWEGDSEATTMEWEGLCAFQTM